MRFELWISTSWSFCACIFFQCRKYFRYSQALEFRFSERQKFSQKLLKKQKTVIGIIVFFLGELTAELYFVADIVIVETTMASFYFDDVKKFQDLTEGVAFESKGKSFKRLD